MELAKMSIKNTLVTLWLAVSVTTALAATPDQKTRTLEHYQQTMKQACSESKVHPEFVEIQKDVSGAIRAYMKRANSMLPVAAKTLPEIRRQTALLKVHPDYQTLVALEKELSAANERRMIFLYANSEPFEKARDAYFAAWDKGDADPAVKKPAPQSDGPTFENVKYGAHQKELMNVWQIESDQPLGVLLNIHGGGWMGGNKIEGVRPKALRGRYHMVSISYPLVNEGAQQPEMLNAGLRAVQFLRSKATEWNIDPQRIVVSGGSAGGCLSLLVALHDDVKNPESDDPVERFSSRVAGAMVAGAQTTMNPFVIKERIGEKTFGNPMPYKPFGAETIHELIESWDAHKELVLECSPMTHLSKDDPPLHLFYNVNWEFPVTKSSNGIHSPIFGEIMLEACKEMGVECHLQYWEKERPKPAVSREQFLEKLLAPPVHPSKSAVQQSIQLTYKTIGDVELQLHVFNPEGHNATDQRPAMVFFHGGGWTSGTPASIYPQCEYLASRGMVAISVEYRLISKHRTTPRECVQDAKSAIRWVRQHADELGVDPTRIAAGGPSAGGHIAAATGSISGFEEAGEDFTVSSKPAALVLYVPVFDNGPGGFGHEKVKSYWKDFSPMHNIGEQTPPTLVLFGTKDRWTPVETVREYKRLMDEKGRRCDLHLYEGGKHGFFMNDEYFIQTAIEMDRFLVSLGFLEKE